MEKYKTGKDLTKESPRSPNVKIAGFAILGRTIDKCRALLFGNVGEYHFDCPLDNELFSFKDIKGDDFKAFVAEGRSDDEIGEWVKKTGMVKSDDEVADWNKVVTENNYSQNAEKKAWLSGEAVKLGLDKDATLFEYLDADDKATVAKAK